MARTRELARIGSNLNQIARWANIHKEDADVLEVVAHLGRAGARHSGRRGGARAMMIKFLARGTGSAAAAADYLTRERSPEHDSDPQKNPEEVKVLRGNPDQVAAVADTLEFEHKYTSGVIAWAPEDNPSDAQIGRVVDEFEKTAWAGLEPDRYAWSAVQHHEADGGCPRAYHGGALRPGDRQESEYRGSRLAEDV